ncbi:hypothetical protein IL306_014600 [Fusarium sp. DS 682]|nr:hypothetical protein IL306_014600 [Fusarium sp. DS 682]
MASEMASIFETVGVKPPFVIVAHSYGAIIAREFLARLPSPTQSVVGMVFVEPNQEKTHQELKTSDHINSRLGSLNRLVATGLHEDHQYSKAEVEAILNHESGTAIIIDSKQENDGDTPSTASSELECMESSAITLADRQQLQKHALSPNPITVIRGDATQDLRRLYTTSGVIDQGTEDMESFLARFADIDRQLQWEILQLSHSARFVQAKKSGHHVEATEPDLIADEVKRMVKLLVCCD